MGCKFFMNKWKLIISSSPDSWNDILGKVKCEQVYQRYEWGEVQKTKGWTPYRFALYDCNNNVLASVQTLTKKRFGIHIVWIPGGIGGDLGLFNQLFRTAVRKNISACVLYFRVNFQIQSDPDLFSKLIINGWRPPSKKLTSEQSMLYKVHGDENDRLLLTSKNWRHNLRRAIKRSGKVKRIFRPDINELIELYSQMEKNKGLETQFTKNQLSSILDYFNKDLIYYECRDEEGKLIAIRAIAVVGSTGWDLLAASNNVARKQYANYAIIWKLLSDLSNNGVTICDMGGVDPTNNPGVFNFKKGLGGKKIDYLGEYEWANIPLLKFFVASIM